MVFGRAPQDVTSALQSRDTRMSPGYSHRYSIPTGISNACAFQYILYYELILHPRYGLNIKRCLATSSLLS